MRVRRIWHPDRRPGLGRTAREFIWITLGQAAAALGSIIGVRLLTSFLPPVEYGTLALGLTVVTLAQQTILSPLSGAALRFWAPAQGANDLNAYLAAVGILVKQSAVVVGIAALGTILTLILLGYSGWATLCVASFFFALASGYSATLDGMQNAARQRILVAWHEGVAPWLRFLAAIGVIQIAGASGSSAMFGYGAASLMVLVSQYGFLRYRMSSLAVEAAASLRQAGPLQPGVLLPGPRWCPIGGRYRPLRRPGTLACTRSSSN
jgi:O-antigen/teichoic acid export membrane protein